MRRTDLCHDAWISMIVVAGGKLADAFANVADDLYPYLIKYGAQAISELDKHPLSRLRRYADGIGRIHEAESKAAE